MSSLLVFNRVLEDKILVCFRDKIVRTTSNTARIANLGSANNRKEHVQEHADQEYHMLAVAVMSAPGNVDRRNAIRKTWKNGYEQRTHYVKFVIGTKGLSVELVESLENENLEQDMLFLKNINDSYENLPHKVLANMAWFDQNVNYSYLLKTDDDVFVMLDRMEDDLRTRNHSCGLYWGWFFPAGNVERQGKWAEPKWKFCDKYFPYAGGGGYVLSADVIHRIVSLADSMIVYNSEDVSVGAWTVVYDIERKHDVRFSTEEHLRGCKNTFVLFHFEKDAVKQMTNKDRLYRWTGKLCARENTVKELEYDWTKLPSQAYKRRL